MLFIQSIDVICTIVATVHDQFDLLISENVKFTDQLTDRFDIMYVSASFR